MTERTSTASLIDTSFVPADIDCSDWSNLEPLFKDLENRKIESVADLERWLRDRSELEAALSEARAERYIRMTCHTNDADAKQAYVSFLENIDPKLKPAVFALDRKYASLPQRRELERRRYEVFDRDTENEVKLFREENVALEVELDKLDQQYNEIIGEMTVEFQGQERTLPQMGKFLEEPDRAVREEAWRLVAERRYRDHGKINDIYDTQIRLRDRVAKNAGFDNFRDYAFRKMRRFDYGPAECEAFHASCEQVIVPVMHRLNRERAAKLGLETLRPWDLNVDPKNRAPLRPFEGAKELVDRSEAIFRKIDPELGALFARLREPGCLDLESRKGKAPGGYQYVRDRSRRPFIFMNAAGLERDVDTMLHEGGHAFHSMLSEKEPLVHYRHSPIEFAEVASMTMELLAHPYVGEFYGEADANRARKKHLEGIVTILPWIATIDAFQHWIYTHPKHTHEEREAFWLSLNDRFGAAIDWTGLEKYLRVVWQRQGHLFGVPFYYIEYGIAQLGALQLWLKYRQDPKAAVEGYKRGLSLGGSRPLPELFEAAGIRFDFGPETVSRLIREVDDELKRLGDA